MIAAAPLVWLPAIGLPIIGILVVLAVALAARRLHREGRGRVALCLRLAAIAGLTLLLLGPMWSLPASAADLRPRVLLLVDTSLSMATEDAGGGELSRLEALRRSWLDTATLAELGALADVRIATFDETLREIAARDARRPRAAGEATRLVAAASEALRGLDTGEIGSADLVLLTDAIDTDGRALEVLAAQAVARGVRVSGVVPGSATRPADVSVQATAATPRVYDGQTTSLRVRLAAPGFEGELATVTVREIRAPGEPGAVVRRERLLLAPVVELDVPVAPALDDGQDAAVSIVEYAVEVDPLPSEAEIANNERRVFVRVAGERIRVCLVEGAPSWESKFLISALRDDPQIELTTVQALGAERVAGREIPRTHVLRYVPGALTSTEQRLDAAPLDLPALRRYDVVVVGRAIERFFPGEEAAALVEYVTEHGGSLVFLRGPAVDDPRAAALLETVAPVRWGRGQLRGGRVAITEAGRREALLELGGGDADRVFRELPGMLSSTVIEAEKALSVVWLRATGGDAATDRDPAVVAHMRAGRGRTLAVLSEGLWRWAFLPPSRREHASVYQSFWSSAIRWLALGGEFLPGQSIAMTTDTLAVRPGEPLRVSVRAKHVAPGDFVPTLRVVAPDGSRTEVALDGDGLERRGIVTASRIGVHELELSAPGMTPDRLTTRFGVYDDRVELDDVAARPEEVAALAEATGGRQLDLDGAAELADLLGREAETRRGIRRLEPAWDRWWIFALLAGVLGVEWLLRRRTGLP